MPVNFDKPEWMVDAACVGVELAIFFPEPGDSQTTIRAAKKVCARCRVRELCLAYALDFEGMPGIWGGTTQRERRKIFREISQTR